jgi:hypothetical protein
MASIPQLRATARQGASSFPGGRIARQNIEAIPQRDGSETLLRLPHHA